MYGNHNTQFLPSCISENQDIELCEIDLTQFEAFDISLSVNHLF